MALYADPPVSLGGLNRFSIEVHKKTVNVLGVQRIRATHRCTALREILVDGESSGLGVIDKDVWKRYRAFRSPLLSDVAGFLIFPRCTSHRGLPSPVLAGDFCHGGHLSDTR